MHMLSFRQGMPLERWYLRYLGAVGTTGYQGFHGSIWYNSAWLPQVPMGITTTVSGYNGMWVPLQRHQLCGAKGANVLQPPLFCQKAIYHVNTPENATFGFCFWKTFPRGHAPRPPKMTLLPQFKTKLTPLHAGACLGGGIGRWPPPCTISKHAPDCMDLGTTVPGYHST